MTNLDDLRKLPTPAQPGWEAGVKWDGNTGEVTTPPITGDDAPQWEEVFQFLGVDPNRFIIDGSVRHSAWEVPGHGICRSYRARIVEKPERTFEVEDILNKITLETDTKGDPEKPKVWRTLQIGDTHIGKSEQDGGGSEIIAERWLNSVDVALDGVDSGTGIHLAFIGDLIEGYVSQDGANISGTDLTLSEQLRVARHLVSVTIQKALATGADIIVSAVPGNHGETTRVQRRVATDSFDIDIVAAVRQAFEMTEYKDRITWYFPEWNCGNVTYMVGDTMFTSVHGHLFKGQLEGAKKWWSGQIVHERPPTSANVLMCGHYHNMQVANFTPTKWIMFSPSLETESTWFAEKTGIATVHGILTYDTMAGKPFNITVA